MSASAVAHYARGVNREETRAERRAWPAWAGRAVRTAGAGRAGHRRRRVGFHEPDRSRSVGHTDLSRVAASLRADRTVPVRGRLSRRGSVTGYRADPFPWWFKIVLVLTRLAWWGWWLGLVVVLVREVV